MTQPIANMKNLRLNKSLHGRSVYRKQDVPGHNVVRYYNTPGKGDGLDLFANAGELIYACHDGVVTRIFGRDTDKLSGCYLESLEAITVYAHIHRKDCIKKGYKVTEGECIGYVGKVLSDPHIHFEAEVNGKVITGATPERMRQHLLEILK